MDDLALELKATAERAEMITRGLPADVREGLAREVFRALRQPLSIQPGGGTSDPGQSFVAPRTVGMTGVETLGEYLAEFGDISHPLRLLAIAGFRFEHDATD